METPSPSKHLPADERRAATVEAVVALAAQTNPSDISTTAIAKHMGVTQGALFKHFPTKESIIEAVMGWVADRLLARIDAATRKAATPLAALEAVFMTHVEFVTIHPGVPRMLFGELQRAEMNGPKRLVQALIARYSERVRALLAQGKAAGEIRANMDEGSAALLFVGMVQGLVMQSLLAGDVRQMSDQAAGVFALFRDALTGAQA
ncbi:MAG: TetR family transcriptional regulator [Comamonas sp. SCN 67-35]|uniref:TetR/AcrR family transcriptional regulator n=1 Tax=unclassified Comamonas TaxID=2638500 RepID=UPI00086F402A|nr:MULTISPECIES: TetR family transcriptional regulator [unclassified Comamonas]MBN9329012.1 TetR family transcriptional regulator [Comamonas sp.]ODU38707.1 MAG: TetR family transcriptional regulator [Comamonas sp. SCN 67-35]OJX01873.1 MAG: TetR family transcriptional regulator [Burkholderiales bacterium 66-26]